MINLNFTFTWTLAHFTIVPFKTLFHHGCFYVLITHTNPIVMLNSTLISCALVTYHIKVFLWHFQFQSHNSIYWIPIYQWPLSCWHSKCIGIFQKYAPQVYVFIFLKWNVFPLVVIIAGTPRTIYSSSLKLSSCTVIHINVKTQ